jgi:hypothetical protein
MTRTEVDNLSMIGNFNEITSLANLFLPPFNMRSKAQKKEDEEKD